jgi:hypothetical protein
MSLQTIGRSHAARRWIGALAVLVLGLRGLVAYGYMLAPVEGRLSVVLCPEAVAGQGLPAMHHGEHATHGMHSNQGPHATLHGAHELASAGSCPFAIATAALLAPQVFKAADPYFVAVRQAAQPAVYVIPAAPPLRHQAPRGPPVFS